MAEFARRTGSDLRSALGAAFASPRVRAILLAGSGLGFLLGFWTLVGHGITSLGGAGAIDTLAYCTAGRSLRVAVGSWRNAGLAILLWPPVIAELDAGNVH